MLLVIQTEIIATVGALFSSDAWFGVTFVTGEIKNPSKILPSALLIGTGIVSAMYLLTELRLHKCIWASLLCLSGKYSDILKYLTCASLLFYVLTILSFLGHRNALGSPNFIYKNPEANTYNILMVLI